MRRTSEDFRPDFDSSAGAVVELRVRRRTQARNLTSAGAEFREQFGRKKRAPCAEESYVHIIVV